jgi:hypothetical protein
MFGHGFLEKFLDISHILDKPYYEKFKIIFPLTPLIA